MHRMSHPHHAANHDGSVVNSAAQIITGFCEPFSRVCSSAPPFLVLGWVTLNSPVQMYAVQFVHAPRVCVQQVKAVHSIFL